MYIKPIHIKDLQQLHHTSPFLRHDWLKGYGYRLTILGIFNKNEELFGAFVTYSFRRIKVFKQVATPPFIPSCELFFNDSTSNPSKKSNFLKDIATLIANYLDDKNQIITLEFPYTFKHFQPFIQKKFKVSTRHTYHIDITLKEDVLLKNMSSERRKNISKAIKDGITVEKVSFTNKQAFNLIEETYKRQNAHVNLKLLKSILKNIDPENGNMFIAKNQKQDIIACNFSVLNKNKCVYKFGGYTQENGHSGAGALLMWEAIKAAKANQSKIFDFDGSIIPSVDRFFRGFGGKLVTYHTVVKAPFALEVLLKTRQRHLF